MYKKRRGYIIYIYIHTNSCGWEKGKDLELECM